MNIHQKICEGFFGNKMSQRSIGAQAHRQALAEKLASIKNLFDNTVIADDKMYTAIDEENMCVYVNYKSEWSEDKHLVIIRLLPDSSIDYFLPRTFSPTCIYGMGFVMNYTDEINVTMEVKTSAHSAIWFGNVPMEKVVRITKDNISFFENFDLKRVLTSGKPVKQAKNKIKFEPRWIQMDEPETMYKLLYIYDEYVQEQIYKINLESVKITIDGQSKWTLFTNYNDGIYIGYLQWLNENYPEICQQHLKKENPLYRGIFSGEYRNLKTNLWKTNRWLELFC